MQELNLWFEGKKREFPWREKRSPYRVWVSEVMLQQTRASVVIPYFLRWMELFPDVKALYMAPLEKIIKAWEGLGYYSRARNLHLAAKEIVEKFNGNIPDSAEALRSIRGFGPYTTAAVLSFGFQKRAAAVDGNVTRVITRYFLIEENISKASVRRKLEEYAESMLDAEKPWITAEALIELGATVCSPKPLCAECPIKLKCRAFKEGKVAELPIKNIEKEAVDLVRSVLVLESEGYFLVRKVDKGKVMADLYEFPYFEGGRGLGFKEVERSGEFLTGEKCHFIRRLDEIRHTFTKYKVRLFPHWFRVEHRPEVEGWKWISTFDLKELPFSAGHRKIVDKLIPIATNKFTF